LGQKIKLIIFHILWNNYSIFASKTINYSVLEILRKDRLLRHKIKNKGNIKLNKAIDSLIVDIEKANWRTKIEIVAERPDADCVHSEGFYFFNINIHRTMILIVFEDNEATIIWTGSHDNYDQTFKGNKKTIENWLRKQGLIK
jgi:mRNA-degrading endonuclease HigB of HigAB toxin-antitoxin module